MAVEILFETHSLSTDNEQGIASGWLPGRLSEQGRRLAAELGARHRGDRLAAVFTSDLDRAVETAEIAFGGSGIAIRRDPRLRECDYGTLNGAPAAVIQAERPAHVDLPFPGGESYGQVVDRVRAFLDELLPPFQGATVLVIGHSATRWALDHLLRGADLAALVGAPFEWRAGWTYTLAARGDAPPPP
ncbi:MAG TPA: histidine phosphatase family protein [Candidatus Limnocylindria bacterium]